MGMKRQAPPRTRRPPWLAALLFVLALCAAPVVATAQSAGLPQNITSMSAGEIRGAAPADDPSRVARWNALKEALFGKRPVLEGTAVVQLEAPPRALDAALVPMTVTLAGGKSVKGLYLVIDNNPSPLAARVTFGPRADPSVLKLRVRVNEYTLVHAVAEAEDGTLYGVEKFVKAAGGCSAPAGADESEALRDIGRMKLRLPDTLTPGRPVQTTLMIRHPNFNGMQMNQITRMYTPARFIRTTEVSYQGENVFRLDSDISLSTNPVITFNFVPDAHGKLHVSVLDSENQRFEQTFDVPAGSAPSAVPTASAPANGAVPEPADFWTGPINSAVPATLTGGTVIRASELAKLLKQERPVIVDVSNTPPRPSNLAPQAVWMPPPHPVIPGSLWLSGVGEGSVSAATDEFYRSRLAQTTSNDLNHPVVVYCHERCWLSWNAAKRAIRYGYRRVYWFPDGIEGWQAAGHATEVAQPEFAPALQNTLNRTG